MAKEKVTLKLTPDALKSVVYFVELSLSFLKLQRGSPDYVQAHLHSVILGGLLKKKLAPAMVFPGKENRISLSIEQALVIQIVSNFWDFTDFDDYTGAVLIDILEKIRTAL